MSTADPRRSDEITLSGVTAYGHHGVLEEEKRDGQQFVIDIGLGLDLTGAATTDDLRRTANYAEVAAVAVEVVQGPSYDLVEKVAGTIADRVLAGQPLVERVVVTVHKPQAPVGVPFGDVAVTVRRRRDVPVVIALGANLEDPVATVRRAGRRLHRVRGLRAVRLSPLYRTQPVGGPPQPDYVNAVALARTSLAAGSLLAALQEIETDAGRTRAVRWGARVLDLDLVQHGDPLRDTDTRSAEPELLLPHPRAHERGFVLVPWSDLDPSAALRVDGATRAVTELLEDVDISSVRPVQEAT